MERGKSWVAFGWSEVSIELPAGGWRAYVMVSDHDMVVEEKPDHLRHKLQVPRNSRTRSECRARAYFLVFPRSDWSILQSDSCPHCNLSPLALLSLSLHVVHDGRCQLIAASRDFFGFFSRPLDRPVFFLDDFRRYHLERLDIHSSPCSVFSGTSTK